MHVLLMDHWGVYLLLKPNSCSHYRLLVPWEPGVQWEKANQSSSQEKLFPDVLVL